MSTLLALLMLSSSAMPERAVQERSLVGLVVTQDSDFEGAESLSELLRRVASTLEAETYVRVRSAEGGQAECKATDDPLYCQVGYVASSFPEASILVLLRAYVDQGRSSIRISGLDLELARDLMKASPSQQEPGPDRQRAILRELFGRGATHRPLEVGPDRSVEDAVREAVAETLSGPLRMERTFARAPLIVHTPTPGRLVVGEAPPELDTAIGTEGLLVRGLAPGRYAVRLSAPGYYPAETEVRIDGRGPVEVRLTLRRDSTGAWRATGYTGLGLLGLAAGLGVYAGVAPSQQSTAEGRPLPRLVAGPGLAVEDSGSGPLVVGLAAGLAVTGGVMSYLGLTADAPDRDPWVEILISVGAGALVYAAVEGVEAAR